MAAVVENIKRNTVQIGPNHNTSTIMIMEGLAQHVYSIRTRGPYRGQNSNQLESRIEACRQRES